MDINRESFRFAVDPCLNVYVDCPLKELNTQMKENKNVFNSISFDILFIANDGIYNRPYLTLEMFNALK